MKIIFHLKLDPKNPLTKEQFNEALDNPINHISSEDFFKEELQDLEITYNMKSWEFYDMYVKGELPDEYVYTRWAFLWRAYSGVR